MRLRKQDTDERREQQAILETYMHALGMDTKAQLDYYPTKGSSPIVYALADLGAQLLAQRKQVQPEKGELTRRNDEAGRPFHQRRRT